MNSLTDNRAEAVVTFLEKSGWGAAKRTPLTADASTRRYERLQMNGRTVLLMDAPPAAESAPCPPDANDAERLALGYNAVARLAGPDSRRFAAFASELRHRGLMAPEVLAADYDNGLMLIEDFGDVIFAATILEGANEAPLYEAAIDVLLHLHSKPAPSSVGQGDGPIIPLLAYDSLALSAEVDLLIEWLYPLLTGQKLSEADTEEYKSLWNPLFASLGEAEEVIVLRDYHAENLLWMPKSTGLERVGIIDFQDGLKGHPAYDLVSLLKDARRDVAPDLADAMMARYLAGAEKRPGFSAPAFRRAAAVLACQRNAKILGIFARLWVRDRKPKYLSFIPRLWRYMEEDLQHPELASLKAWFDKVFPSSLRLEPKPQ